MSTFGIFHTGVSILPIFFGLAALVRDHKIDPKNLLGQLYIGTMLLGCITAFGFIPTKGLDPPQGLTVLTLVLLYFGTLTITGKWRDAGHVQNICLSASYFLLWFFTTTETLTRLPLDHPFASGPTDPALNPVRALLLVALVLGVGYQVYAQRAATKGAGSPRHEVA
jgi:hypothetical protein